MDHYLELRADERSDDGYVADAARGCAAFSGRALMLVIWISFALAFLYGVWWLVSPVIWWTVSFLGLSWAETITAVFVLVLSVVIPYKFLASSGSSGESAVSVEVAYKMKSLVWWVAVKRG